MIRKSGHRFSDKIMLNHNLKRDGFIALRASWMQFIGQKFKLGRAYLGSDPAIACQI
jgi:hypothetical protein